VKQNQAAMLPKIKIKNIDLHNYYFTTECIHERKFVQNYHIVHDISCKQLDYISLSRMTTV